MAASRLMCFACRKGAVRPYCLDQTFPTDQGENGSVEPEAEAAGIEPASDSPPMGIRDFTGLGRFAPREDYVPDDNSFTFRMELGHTLTATVREDGYLVLSDEDDINVWGIPPDKAIARLETLLAAMRIKRNERIV